MKHSFQFLILTLVIFQSISECLSQKISLDARKMHSLDTIIYVKSICRNDANLRALTYCKQADESILLNYYNTQIHGDTFRIIRLNFPSLVIDSFDIIVNKGKEDYKNGIMSFDMKDSCVVILLSNKILVLNLDNTKSVKKINSLKLNPGEVYQSVRFIDSATILLSRSYNYNRPDLNFQKTSLSLVNIKSLKIIKAISPKVSIIELSHMRPYTVICVSHNQILVGQNNRYSFEVYDYSLNRKRFFDEPKKFSDFKVFDTLEVRKLSKISAGDPSHIISYLQPKFRSGFAFVDGYFSLGLNKILIRYTYGENSIDTFYRRFDVLNYDSNTFEYKISDTSYLLKNPPSTISLSANTIIDKSNYFIDFWLNQSIFGLNNTVVLSKGTNIYPLGLSIGELNQKENQYYKTNDAIFRITLLKNQY